MIERFFAPSCRLERAAINSLDLSCPLFIPLGHSSAGPDCEQVPVIQGTV
jgi:hypothetical protein